MCVRKSNNSKICFLLFLFFISQITFSQSNKYGLAIHGGAGMILKSNMTPEKETEYIQKLNDALQTGYKILENGGSSLDAVVAVINIMEDSPLFNAGKGAVLTEKGVAELDASIMDGKTLKAGAVAGIKHVKNPITLARLVMDKSPHVMMIGEGAEEFAKENNMEMVENNYFAFRLPVQDIFDQIVQHEMVAAGKGLDKPGGILMSLHGNRR